MNLLVAAKHKILATRTGVDPHTLNFEEVRARAKRDEVEEQSRTSGIRRVTLWCRHKPVVPTNVIVFAPTCESE